MTQRNEVASFIRTAFALATGSLDPDNVELTARNGLAAFEVLPSLIRDGHLGAPETDIEEFALYDVLVMYALTNDADLENLSDDELSVIAAASEEFFTDVIADAELIPMSIQDRREILASMVFIN